MQVILYETNLDKTHKHVCDNYLLYLQNCSRMVFDIKDVNIRMTEKITLPYIAYANNYNYMRFTENDHTIYCFITPVYVTPVAIDFDVEIDPWATFVMWGGTPQLNVVYGNIQQSHYLQNRNISLIEKRGMSTAEITPNSSRFQLLFCCKYHDVLKSNEIFNCCIMSNNVITSLNEIKTEIQAFESVAKAFAFGTEGGELLKVNKIDLISGIYVIPYSIATQIEDLQEKQVIYYKPEAATIAFGWNIPYFNGQILYNAVCDPLKNCYFGNAKQKIKIDETINGTQKIDITFSIVGYAGTFSCNVMYNGELYDYTNALKLIDYNYSMSTETIQQQISDGVKYVSSAIGIIAGIVAIVGSGGSATPFVAAAGGAVSVASNAGNIATTALDQYNSTRAQAITSNDNIINVIFYIANGIAYETYGLAFFKLTPQNNDDVVRTYNMYGYGHDDNVIVINTNVLNSNYNKNYIRFIDVRVNQINKPNEYCADVEQILLNGTTIWTSTQTQMHYLDEIERIQL